MFNACYSKQCRREAAECSYAVLVFIDGYRCILIYDISFDRTPVAGFSVRGDFDGGAMSSDFGPMILRGVDRQIGLTERLSAAIDDWRHPFYVTHEMREMIAQRVYQIACAYEDGNDANALRRDPLFKLGLERKPLDVAMDLASAPTFSRLDNAVGARDLLPHCPGLRRDLHRQLPEGATGDCARHGPLRRRHPWPAGVRLLQSSLRQSLLLAAVSLRGPLGEVHHRGAASRQAPHRRRERDDSQACALPINAPRRSGGRRRDWSRTSPARPPWRRGANRIPRAHRG